MNVSTTTCVDSQAITRGVVRGNSDKLVMTVGLMTDLA